MNIITTTKTEIRDGDRSFEINIAPMDHDSVRIIDHEDGTTTVAYLVYDDSADAYDPLKENEGVDVVWFNNGAERDAWLEENEPGERDFLIERYEHGLVHYSVLNTGQYVDRRWDVASGVGVLTLDEDWTSDDLVKLVNVILDEYSSWCNGDIYGLVHLKYDADQNEIDDWTCWGFIGWKHAEEELAAIA